MLTGCQADSKPKAPAASGGPVSFVGSDSGFTPVSGVFASAGDRVVYGATTVRNAGQVAATLRSAHLVGDVDSAAAAISAVRVMDLSGTAHDLVGAALWPFEDFQARSEPLAGFELLPGREAELLIIVDVAETGDWHWPTTAVDYEVQGTEYRDEAPFGFHICPSEDVCQR